MRPEVHGLAQGNLHDDRGDGQDRGHIGWQETLGQGMAAETGAAIALFGSTALGAPVSTTHTVAGAVTGVGAVTGGCR